MNSHYSYFSAIASSLATVLIVSACGQPETFERAQMLKDTTDQTILPTHGALGERADSLESSVEQFCDGERTQSQLESAREAWSDLQEPLKQIQAWSFNMSPYRGGGEFGTNFYRSDWEPSDGEAIEGILEGEGEIDEQRLAEESYHDRTIGYPAVEYLLFGTPEGEETLVSYQGDDSAGERRCSYLVAATSRAREATGEYVDTWARDGGNFAGVFDSESPENMDWTTIQDSIDAMVTQMVFVSKNRLSQTLLGGPLGEDAEDDGSVSSPHANASLAQIEATLDGLEMLYAGPDGQSLADYTRFRKQSVHQLVRKRIDDARAAIEEIPEPLAEAVENDPEAVEQAQAAVDELTATLEADLKTTLGASTTQVIVDSD